jgi:hypothetical protein
MRKFALAAALATTFALPVAANANPVAQFNIDVANLWGFDTGFTGQAGQTFNITTTGIIDAAAGNGGGYVVDANGVLQQDAGEGVSWYFMNYVNPYTAPLAGETRDYLPGLAFGSLIGRWDSQPSWDLFFIGTDSQITVPVDGAQLTLFVTDGSPWDNVGTYQVTISTLESTVPEPATFGLVGLALAALVGTGRRRSAQLAGQSKRVQP